mmetsp:Transcript_15387/g.43629  ORF Transcript_15387/g.43629 Transcript_15387/m.43629 type:complete len:105 (-) Transcript_15387:25-339(-)
MAEQDHLGRPTGAKPADKNELVDLRKELAAEKASHGSSRADYESRIQGLQDQVSMLDTEVRNLKQGRSKLSHNLKEIYELLEVESQFEALGKLRLMIEEVDRKK